MKKLVTVFCILMVLFMLPALSSAVLIDFEAYSDFQNLNGIDLGGVILNNPTNNIVEIYDNRFGVASHSGTKAIGSFSGPASVNPLVGVFNQAVSYVSLWGGDGGNDTDNWTLNLYDAAVGGNLLGNFNSGDWNGYPYTQLSGSFASIWRFEAIWNGPSCCGVGFDDLEFTVASVPEPSTLLLLGSGLLGFGFFARKRIKG